MSNPDPRIRALRLRTSAQLTDMKAFYCDLLGLPILCDTADAFTIAGGATRITFSRSRGVSTPFYHIAFNIPKNKILSAREWQRQRTPLLKAPEKHLDPAYPGDVRYFSHWNAHAVFFLDPAGNVLEYIARHDLNYSAAGPFSSADILYASEIAFIVDDVSKAATKVKQAFALQQYRQSSDQFCVLGDETGLLLIFRRGRDLAPGSDEARPAKVFETGAVIRGASQKTIQLQSYPYTISSEPHRQ